MLINLFDIGFSCNWRCQWNNFALLLCICAAVFVHHCGIVCGLETIKAIEATATAPSKTAEIIKKNSSVAAAVKKPATPSSAIYIPALDGISPNSHGIVSICIISASIGFVCLCWSWNRNRRQLHDFTLLLRCLLPIKSKIHFVCVCF